MLVRVYTCQNATLLRITCGGSLCLSLKHVVSFFLKVLVMSICVSIMLWYTETQSISNNGYQALGNFEHYIFIVVILHTRCIFFKCLLIKPANQDLQIFVRLIIYIPVNNFSFMLGWVFLG